METRKLYYEDSHLRQFTAVVTDCQPVDTGWETVLDATAFYPEGGGQACDNGTLNGVAVLDVRENDGKIIHLCDGPLTPGQLVEGKLDWTRRFDLMQQHSGEHMVSGIIHRRFGWHNVGFHMGSEVVTIDFDGSIPASSLQEIEEEVNRRIWENLPVRCWYPSEAQLPSVSYRTKRQLPWPVRIVEIPGVDSCACCGTHVAATGEIGFVKLFSCVKFHQGVRIEMACGARALDFLSKVYEQNRQVSQAFSAKVLETGDAARKMNEALGAEKFRAVSLQKQLLAKTAEAYAGCKAVLHFEKDLSPAGVRELAEKIAEVCTGVAAVFSGEDGRWDVCLARPGTDIRELGSRMAKALDGRGGGKTGFFQGTVKGTKSQIEDFFGKG